MAVAAATFGDQAPLGDKLIAASPRIAARRASDNIVVAAQVAIDVVDAGPAGLVLLEYRAIPRPVLSAALGIQVRSVNGYLPAR